MNEKRFTLRMDLGLFEDISSIAGQHRRSVAKEMECAIAKYIYEIKQGELLNGVDPDTLSEEESKHYIRELNLLRKKYQAFEFQVPFPLE